MAMPKAPVNKNDLPAPPKDNIRATNDVNRMEAVAIAKPPQDRSYREFRPCVLGPNQRHLVAALAFRQWIPSAHHESAEGRTALSFRDACMRLPLLPMSEVSAT
jgi:hypothetical protein